MPQDAAEIGVDVGVLQMMTTKTVQGMILNIKFDLEFLFFSFFFGHFVQMFHKLGDFSLELLLFCIFY